MVNGERKSEKELGNKSITLREKRLTKRDVFFESCTSILDPLYFLSNFTTKGEILIQVFWRHKHIQ